MQSDDRPSDEAVPPTTPSPSDDGAQPKQPTSHRDVQQTPPSYAIMTDIDPEWSYEPFTID